MATENLTVYPQAYDKISIYCGSVANATNPEGKGSGNSTYCSLAPKTKNTENYIRWPFDLSSIPDEATIDSIECKFKAKVVSTGYVSWANAYLSTGSTRKGSAESFYSSTATARTIQSPGAWTLDELRDCYLLLTWYPAGTSSASYIYFYGADLTVTYTYQSEKFMLKLGGSWTDVARVFKKVSGIWVEQTDLANVIEDGVRYKNGGEYVVELPEGYTRLEYIESTGSQYIDTGFKPNQNTRVVVDVDIDTASAERAIFGARTAYQSKAFCVWTSVNNAGYQSDYNAEVANTGSPVSSGRHVIDRNKNVLTVDGSVVHTHTAGTFQTDYNMFLLQVNNAGSIMSAYPFSGKLYSCRIYDNGTQIRNYVPCANANGAAGVYDTVNGNFYEIGSDGSVSIISFVVSGSTYQAESGMTWSQWTASDYNTGGFFAGSVQVLNSEFSVVTYNGTDVTPGDTIQANATYSVRN